MLILQLSMAISSESQRPVVVHLCNLVGEMTRDADRSVSVVHHMNTRSLTNAPHIRQLAFMATWKVVASDINSIDTKVIGGGGDAQNPNVRRFHGEIV